MGDRVYSWFARRTLTEKLYLLFSFPVLFLILGTTVSVLTFQAVGSTIALAKKSDAIRSQINVFLKELYLSENATRGYFLGRKDYLLPSMVKSMDDLAHATGTLVALVADSPSQAQRERAAIIQTITLRHLQDLKGIVARGPQEAMTAGAEFIMKVQEQGRDFTIAALMEAFDKEAIRIQLDRQRALESRRQLLLVVTLSGAIIILLTTGLGVVAVMRTVTEPMAALTRVATQIGAARAVSFPEADRLDEVGVLSRSMADVDRQVRDHVDRLIQSEADTRRLNASLQAAERRYRSLVEQAPLGIFSTVGMRWTFANRVQRELMGLPDSIEPSFEHWRLALHPDDRDRVIPEVRAAMARGRPLEDAFRFLWPDGTVRHVFCHGVAIDDQPEGPCTLWINLDVTQLEELQQRLAPAERLAAMTRMATSIAHDLRTPLLGLERGLERIHRTSARHLDRDARKLLEELWAGARLAVGIVQDILDLYRHAYGPLPLSYSCFSVVEMVQEVVDLMTAEIDARALNVRIVGPPLVVEADRRRLARVIVNLLENAVKNSPQGGRVWISLGVRPGADRQVTIVVEDEGEGIHLAEWERLSKHDVPQTMPSRGGTGLGLYICRIIIEAHRGTLLVENRPQGGARFELCVPAAGQPGGEDVHTVADRRRSTPI